MVAGTKKTVNISLSDYNFNFSFVLVTEKMYATKSVLMFLNTKSIRLFLVAISRTNLTENIKITPLNRGKDLEKMIVFIQKQFLESVLKLKTLQRKP